MKLLKKIFIGSLSAFMLLMFIGCPASLKKETFPNNELQNPYSGENKLGKIGSNLVYDGDADDCDGEILSFDNNNVVMTKVDGGVTGQAWKINQTGEWSELVVDLTDYYGQGKSFLISAKVKNDPEAEAKYQNASFTSTWCLYSGDVKNWATENDCQHYDFDESKADSSIVGPWGGEKDVTGEDFGYTEDDFNSISELSDEWQEIKFIVSSTEIEKIVNNSGVYKFEIEFYAGKDGAPGYSYLIDDLSIQDLNSERFRHGKTWKDPNAEEELEGEEELEEEE